MLYKLFYLIQSVIIPEKNILLFKYNDNLTINDIKYRETSIPPNFNGVFALEMDRGSYYFNANNLSLKTFNKYEILPVQNDYNNKIINNSTLVNYNYSCIKSHKLHIAYQIVLYPCNKCTSINKPNISLVIDNIVYNTPVQNNGYSVYKNITLPRGQHTVKIISNSNTNWCSILSKGDGFESARHLYSWIEYTNLRELYAYSSIYLIILIGIIITDESIKTNIKIK